MKKKERRRKIDKNGAFSRLSEQPNAPVAKTRHPGRPATDETERRELEREKETEQNEKKRGEHMSRQEN